MEARFRRTQVETPTPSGGPATLRSLDHTTQRIYTLNAIAEFISREENFDRVLETALDWVLEITGAEGGVVYLRDGQSDDLVLAASKGLRDDFLAEHRRLHKGQALSGVVAESGKPLVVNDVPADPRALDSSRRDGIRSFAGVPLRSDNRVVGVLSVLSRTRRAFTTADMELLSSIANQIGVAAAKVRLRSEDSATREQLRQKMNQLSELLKVSATFRASAPVEQVLNAICSSIRNALGFRLVEVSLLDTSTGKMTPTAFTGFTPAQWEQIRQVRRSPDFYEHLMQPRFRISNSYFIPHQANIQRQLGARWAFLPEIDDEERGEDEWHRDDALVVPIRDRDGKLVGMLYADDPQDRKVPSLEQIQVLEMFVQQAGMAIENANLLHNLQRSEASYRLLTENATDLIFLLDPDGVVAFASGSIKSILGTEPEAVVGRRFEELVAPASAASLPDYLTSPRSAAELDGRCEVEMLRTDGMSAFLEISGAPVYDGGQFVGEQGIGRDISDKKRMEREIARRQRQLRRSLKREEQLTGYAATVIAAQEEERRRIARDLHDDTAQALIALSRRIEALQDEMARSPSSAAQKLVDLKTLADQTLTSVRRFSRDLRPSVLDDLGLVPALEWLVSETARRYKITTRLKVHGEERRLPEEIELACFRIAQEALNNVAKHAEASGAALEMYFGTSWCRLVVSDNGKGFASPPVISDLAGRGRMGVMGMHERTSLLGGTFSMRTAPGEGTRIIATIPIAAD